MRPSEEDEKLDLDVNSPLDEDEEEDDEYTEIKNMIVK